MIRLLFLLPVVLCVLWTLFLWSRGYRIRSGAKGYIYITLFSAVIATFYTLMLWLTAR
ncbi:hypothetical protein [Idiomarina tyrosinivorans]|uniref:hypothetical protein n=1 Tax=Idiomarina tyrosinivorans TaxID=1445662 RepID=UPI0018E58424|nr:hypothetical protein [Idiomarina tyrosinivorans]